MIINTLIQMLSPMTAIKFSLIISQFKDPIILYSHQFSGSKSTSFCLRAFLLKQPTARSDKDMLIKWCWEVYGHKVGTFDVIENFFS